MIAERISVVANVSPSFQTYDKKKSTISEIAKFLLTIFLNRYFLSYNETFVCAVDVYKDLKIL